MGRSGSGGKCGIDAAAGRSPIDLDGFSGAGTAGVTGFADECGGIRLGVDLKRDLDLEAGDFEDFENFEDLGDFKDFDDLEED